MNICVKLWAHLVSTGVIAAGLVFPGILWGGDEGSRPEPDRPGVVNANDPSGDTKSKSGANSPTQGDETVPGKSASEHRPIPRPVQRRIGELDWHTDYPAAYRAAEQAGQQLLILFLEPAAMENSPFLVGVLARPELKADLTKVTRVILSTHAVLPSTQLAEKSPSPDRPQTEGTIPTQPAAGGVQQAAGQAAVRPQRLLNHVSFAFLYGQSGLAVLDLADKKAPTFGRVISAHPFSGRVAYGWSQVQTILHLPRGTVTQRAMIFALREQPERPQSVYGQFHPYLGEQALASSQLMAQYGSVGHHDWGTRSANIMAVTGSSPFEVAAVSFGAPQLIDAAFEIVQNWKGSGAHWGGIASPSRVYGYDMAPAGGVWYGTGLFAN